MEAASQLQSDGIGALYKTEVVLDCRERGRKERCVQGEHSEAPESADMNASPSVAHSRGRADSRS